MKIKTTKKEVRKFYKIIGAGYCSMQNLLRYKEPFAYSERAEGWACDYYNINGILISTGYAPLNSKNVNFDYATLKEYEDKSGNIIYSNINWQEGEKQVNELLYQFIEEC